MQCLTQLYNKICTSQAKYRIPYNFQFSGQDALAINTQQFQSNFVKTSKYTWYNFLPKSLLVQFKRLANIYFLLIAVLQSISVISPLSPATAWVPLIVVLAISMLREGYEDYQRYKSDQEVNNQIVTQVRRQGQFVNVQWNKVVVGDICCVQEEELFPADLILLTSSSEGGVAFIETASLDGQKNLKPRNSHKSTIKLNDEEILNKLNAEWKGAIPDKQLHKFSSSLVIEGETIVYEGDKQLLYRGARLKNTKWVYGLVIYTGKNTKIMMNSQSSSQKMSQIEVKVNKVLVIILIIQVIMCFIMGLCFGIWANKYPYISDNIQNSGYSVASDSVLIFLSYLVLLNTMIPISLIVSIQIVKVSQSYFINKDTLMYSKYRKKSASVKTASLNQQLGQIQYIFTDKTGTLTMNLMEFKIAIIGQKMYGDKALICNTENYLPQNQKGFKDDGLVQLLNNGTGNQNLGFPLQIKGGPTISITSQKQLCEQYMKILSTAHEVVGQQDKNGNIKYQGPSPDQITLVQTAKQMQYQFIKSNQSSVTLKIKGEQKQIQLLQIFPFNSDRKRMSIIIKDHGIIKMYCKGADSIIKQRLAKDNILNLDTQLNKFSRIGLRTLLVAMKTIREEDYNIFKQNIIKLNPQNRQKSYEKLVSQLQRNLYLIGATAVLDKLQDFVPETIRDLIRAKIKIWMLTGDKMETAENIAKSCNLIQNQFQIIRYLPERSGNMFTYLRNLVKKSEQLTKNNTPKAFLIQGLDLTPILANQQGQNQLANLAKNCQAVVCCRLLPIQKAEVVDVVRKKLDKITLAIGDGANDVPMIKTAHIGIGLFGEQGMGAVQASDYALGEFRMLWRLLLVHGRWNYIRISDMILYFFYKNMLFTLPQFIFGFYCAFSGQSLFDDWYISLYNLIFTSIPLVVRAIFEQDVNYIIKKHEVEKNTEIEMHSLKTIDPVILRQEQYLPPGFVINKYLYRLFPKMYFIGQHNCIFNYRNYTIWIVESFIQGIALTLLPIYIFDKSVVNETGINSDLWLVSLTIFSGVICVVTFKLCAHTKFWSIIFAFCVIILSLCIYLAYMWISNYTISTYILGTNIVAWTSTKSYLVVIFCCCIVLFVDGIILHIDFIQGGYSSKVRKIIDEHMQQHRSYYDELSLKITDGLSQAPFH